MHPESLVWGKVPLDSGYCEPWEGWECLRRTVCSGAPEFKFKNDLSVESMWNIRRIPWSLCLPTLPLKSVGDPLGGVFALSCCAWFNLNDILAYSKYLWVSWMRMCSSRPFHVFSPFHLPLWFLPPCPLANKKLSPFLLTTCVSLALYTFAECLLNSWLTMCEPPGPQPNSSARCGEESKSLEEKASGSGMFGICVCVCEKEHCLLSHVLIAMSEGYQNGMYAQKLNYEIKYLFIIIKVILLYCDVYISHIRLP